jgi:glycosyltransferase involved in cell wall biosynthesis
VKNSSISICIPTFRQADKLKILLESIERQSVQPNEIIVSDDSDNDEVELVCKAFILPIKYFKNETALGSPENWNAAISKASFDWVKLMHHDDYFTHDSALEMFVHHCEEEPEAAYIFCGTTIQQGVSGSTAVYLVDKKLLARLTDYPGLLIHKNLIGAPSTGFFKRELNLRYDPKLVWLVDIEYYFRVLVNSKVSYLDNPAITTIMFEGQLTNRLKGNREVELSEFLYCYLKHFKQFNQLNQRILNQRMLDLIRIFGLHSANEFKFNLTNQFVPFWVRLFFLISKLSRRIAFSIFYRLNKYKLQP